MTKYFFLFFIFVANLGAQIYERAIEDNSILIEEAYNQEERVIQHIFSMERLSGVDLSLDFSFTQELPAGGRAHQLSYSIPFSYTKSNGSSIGDIWLNYRYQLIDDETFAVSPRASLILPTGKVDGGNGNGKPGVAINFPASKRFSNNFVAHYNIGGSIIPDANQIGGSGKFIKTINDYFFGASGIWLATYNFNLMIELLYENNSPRDETDSKRNNETMVNPALRFAVDIGNLQIVPILSAPIYFGEGKTSANFLFYISFEHNF